jgi:hypothetical protein
VTMEGVGRVRDDEQNPMAPGEPPEQVRSEVLWRLAVRLYRDHAGATDHRCGSCHQPWPCSARRLAELGLSRAAV